MNLAQCVLLLVLGCGSKQSAALNVSHAAAALADTYTTQRVMSLCRVTAGCNPKGVEANPLAAIFQENGKPIAYASTVAGIYGTSLLAAEMRRSSNRTIRRLAWLPQTLLIGAHTYGFRVNLGTFRNKMAECGRGCQLALGGR